MRNFAVEGSYKIQKLGIFISSREAFLKDKKYLYDDENYLGERQIFMMKITKKKWWWGEHKVFEKERQPEVQCIVEEVRLLWESELYP